MPTQPNESNELQPQNDMLRFLIREAVERELAARMGSLTNTVQIVSGKVDQLNRDYGGAQKQVEQLTNIVQGNPQLNLVGLAVQIKNTEDAIKALGRKLDDWEDRFAGYTNQIRGARYALGALVIVGAFSAFPQLMLVLRAIGMIP